MRSKPLQLLILVSVISICQASCKGSEFGKKKRCPSIIRAIVSGTSDKELYDEVWENQSSGAVTSNPMDAVTSSSSYAISNFYDPNYGFSVQSLDGDFNDHLNKENIEIESHPFEEGRRRQQRQKKKIPSTPPYHNFPDYKALLDTENYNFPSNDNFKFPTKDNFKFQAKDNFNFQPKDNYNFQSSLNGFKPLDFDLYSPHKYYENYQDQHPRHRYPEVNYASKEYEKYLSKLFKSNNHINRFKGDSSESEENDEPFPENSKPIFRGAKPIFGENKPIFGGIKPTFGEDKPAFGEPNPYLENFFKHSQSLKDFDEQPANYFENSGFMPSNFGNQRPRYTKLYSGEKRIPRNNKRRPNSDRYTHRYQSSRRQCRGSSCFEVQRRPLY